MLHVSALKVPKDFYANTKTNRHAQNTKILHVNENLMLCLGGLVNFSFSSLYVTYTHLTVNS
jgi:hypothetical protein